MTFWGSVVDFGKRKSTQIVAVAGAVAVVAFGAGVVYQKSKHSSFDQELNDDQLDRISSGHVLHFEGKGVRIQTYRHQVDNDVEDNSEYDSEDDD